MRNINEKLMGSWNETALQQVTMVSSIPSDIAEKLLRIRDSIVADDVSEAFHWLYKIADPDCEKREPWEELEIIAGRINQQHEQETH